ncbi:cobalt ECF transporter T component CbiQ [Siculibacillus lacustris]|uniref:Cobalt ECF transporter T component CbiQ n=1 Tax=Siculibacillus lacustris TaxID=1549641 RepID=A0A4Q9VNZ4_9HYPH|nr:cobalt ECF transporter T component CbiQ [Siculibacillus lacustris]TBW37405.1 cobalt ECF transporter T component CbiQ [Siculibacillus lacustris]
MSPIDRIAHANRWRDRSLAEKATLGLGLLALALGLPAWPTGPVILAVASLAAIGGAGVPWRAWAWTLAGPLGFVLTGAATLLIEIGPDGVALAPHGVEAAAALTLRSLAAMSGLLCLAVTTPATDLVAATRRLGVPEEITEIALLTHRFLFLLADTALAMDAAQASRLGHVGVRRRIRSAGILAANLLPRALDRARRLETGLAARGWTGGGLAVLSRRRPVSPAGLAAVLATLAAVAAIGWIAR